MTTDLARAWEKDIEVRAKARQLEAVPWTSMGLVLVSMRYIFSRLPTGCFGGFNISTGTASYFFPSPRLLHH